MNIEENINGYQGDYAVLSFTSALYSEAISPADYADGAEDIADKETRTSALSASSAGAKTSPAA